MTMSNLESLSCIHCGGPRAEDLVPKNLTIKQLINCDWCTSTDLFVPSSDKPIQAQKVDAQTTATKRVERKPAPEINPSNVQAVATMLFSYYEPLVKPKLAYCSYERDVRLKISRFSNLNERTSWIKAIADTPSRNDEQLTVVEHLERAMVQSSGRAFDALERRRRDLKNWPKESIFRSEIKELLSTQFNVGEFRFALSICRGEQAYHPQG